MQNSRGFFAPVQYALPRVCLQQYVDAHLNKRKLGSGQKNATTVPIDRILSVKNVRALVSMDFK